MTEVRRNRYGKIVRNLSYKTKLKFKKNALDNCNICGKKCDHYEVDHIVPLLDGGNDLLSNLQLLCYECHKTKSIQEVDKRKKSHPLYLIFSNEVGDLDG